MVGVLGGSVGTIVLRPGTPFRSAAARREAPIGVSPRGRNEVIAASIRSRSRGASGATSRLVPHSFSRNTVTGSPSGS